jgi:hypothetical protein
MKTTWKSYEEVAAYLLAQNAAEFGLKRVEGKQSIPGYRSGTSWEIDAKGIREGNEGFVIIECRSYTNSKQNQQKLKKKQKPLQLSCPAIRFDNCSARHN